MELVESDPESENSLPDDMGEMSIYGCINALRNEQQQIPTLVLFEDNWFIRNQYARPSMTHLVSLVAFLKYAEHVIPGFSFREAVSRIKNTRPYVNLADHDDPDIICSQKKKANGRARCA